jgi:hypothetical protein
MRFPRLLTRQLHRAFPELDIYSDAQCRRFMRSAARGVRAWWHTALYIVVALGGLAGAIAAGAVIFNWHDNYLNQLRRDDALITAGAYLACAVMLPLGPLASLLARDLLLQRRVRWVLRNRSSCPACRSRLIGLPLTSDSTITCPECGFVAAVDPSLGELTLDAHGLQQYVPSIREPVRKFWTRERARKVLKWSMVIVGVPLVLALSYEGFIQWQAWRARSLAAELATQFTKVKSARIPEPNAAGNQTGALVLEGVSKLTLDYDHRLLQVLPTTSDNTPVYPDPGIVLPRQLTNVVADYPAVAMALMRRINGEYEKLGVFAKLDELQLCVVLRGPSHPLEDWSYLGNSRKFGLYNSLRMMTARERADWDEYVRAFETNLAVVRLLRSEATGVVEAVAGILMQAHLLELRRLLAANPSADLLARLNDAMQRQSLDVPIQTVIENERIGTRRMVAEVFSKPANARLGKWGLNEDEGWGRPPGFEKKRLGTLSGNLKMIDVLSAQDAAGAALPPASRALQSTLRGETGYLLLDWGVFGADRLLEWHEGLKLDLACATVYVDLERFKAATGAYPATLAELVPGFLTELPQDPLVCGPFGYKAIASDPHSRGYLLYSVGPDGVDNGGAGLVVDSAAFRGGAPGKPEFYLAKPGQDIVLNAALPK